MTQTMFARFGAWTALRPGRARPRWMMFLWLCGISAVRAANPSDIVRVGEMELQQAIDLAPSNALVWCDPNRMLTLSRPVVIRKPMSLAGLRARLPERLGHSPLVVVEAQGVAITDFELWGNAATVPQSERAPLLVVHAGDFRVERGRMTDSSKDGIMIDGGAANEDLVGGVVRDIVGVRIRRDVVSISGSSGKGHRIRNVLVDNVRCYESALRGAVEVSDGTDNITVRKVYAESSVYAIDVQDHQQPLQSNHNVVLEDIYAVRCQHALRTANTRQGHANLTVRDVTADQCDQPIRISHTDHVALSNVRVLNHQSGQSPLHLRNCHGVVVRDVLVANATVDGPALLLENCQDVLVDGVSLGGPTNRVTNAVTYRISREATFTGLCISHVQAPFAAEAGIVLESVGNEKGTLTNYLITGNLATVRDAIQGQGAVVINNLP